MRIYPPGRPQLKFDPIGARVDHGLGRGRIPVVVDPGFGDHEAGVTGADGPAVDGNSGHGEVTVSTCEIPSRFEPSGATAPPGGLPTGRLEMPRYRLPGGASPGGSDIAAGRPVPKPAVRQRRPLAAKGPRPGKYSRNAAPSSPCANRVHATNATFQGGRCQG